MPSTPKAPVPITGPALLIVEGPGDEMFFNALLKYLGEGRIQVRNCGGIDALDEDLRRLLSTSNFREKVLSLGIIADADDDHPNVNFQKVRTILQNAGLTVPERPLQLAEGNPHTSVLMIPDENTPGRIEDLCLRSVNDDPAMPCVNRYFECTRAQNIPMPRIMAKARAQVYLASKREVGFGVGRAAEEDHGYWDWEHRAFDQVKAFLQQIAS